MATKRPGVVAAVHVGWLLTPVRTLRLPAPIVAFRSLLITLMLLRKTGVLISVRIGSVACIDSSVVLFLLHFKSLKTVLAVPRVLFLSLLGILPMYPPIQLPSAAIGRSSVFPLTIAVLSLPLICKWF
jgi:hypothetical protein